MDTTAEGDLEKCKAMGVYRETLEFASFMDTDAYNYSFNIYEDGNVLEICGMSSKLILFVSLQ